MSLLKIQQYQYVNYYIYVYIDKYILNKYLHNDTYNDIIYIYKHIKSRVEAMKPLDHLALMQIERRLKSIRVALKDTKVRPGWINYMRQALGMTLQKLAERTKVSKSTIAQAERGEAKGKITIETLKKMAEAMECEFVYAFVPKKTIKITLKEKALEKAKRILLEADTHMTLENQRVEQDIKARVERLADTLIVKGDVW